MASFFTHCRQMGFRQSFGASAMRSNLRHAKSKGASSRRSMARTLVGLVELLVFAGALFWLLNSERSRGLWVWLAVGLPLFLAYVFVGGYVRHRLDGVDEAGSPLLKAPGKPLRGDPIGGNDAARDR
jgi:hypothetical protein